jgi:hypothetical protein
MKAMSTMVLALVAVLAAIVTAPAQQAGNGFEKKSYNYAEWAKNRFSEVVTVRNPARSSISAASAPRTRTAPRAG